MPRSSGRLRRPVSPPEGRRPQTRPAHGAPALLAVATLLFACPAPAQSAADKATARQAASEGIKLYDAGKYDEALDRMRRAQELYDAPVHLLYIARAQAKVGQLVEAAENYRLLAQYKLGRDAPKPWSDAIDTGKKELAELEPRIPSLKINVEPQDAKNVELKIDGQPVSTAVIGIARPVNPGSHRVTVSGPGYKTTEATVEVAEQKSEELTLKLEAAPAGAGAAGAAPVVAGPDKPKPEPEPAGKDEPSSVGFMVGLRLGVVVPSGTLCTSCGAGGTADLETNEFFGASAGAEIHGGLRFAKYFTAVLFGEFHSLAGNSDGFPMAANIEAGQASARSGGLGILVGTPRNQVGGFGELGILFRQEFLWEGTAADCTVDATLAGPALRIGGGGVFPVADFLHLAPFGMLSVGQFTSVNVDQSSGCDPVLVDRLPSERTIDSENQATHTLFFVGVGGDVVFGGDRPRD